jgi:hypothetical protein
MAGTVLSAAEQSERSGNRNRPVTIGWGDLTLAITRQELELEQARLRDTSH